MENPLSIALKKVPGGVLFLDGGFATHLETLGADLKDDLWSAKLLITNPSLIVQVHYDYIKSGANIIITSSYQASIDGFKSAPYNLSYEESINKMSESVILASKAIKKYKKENKYIKNANNDIIIAGSIGCYGAGLHDGSEYTGYYGDNVNEYDLRIYHSVKIHSLMNINNINNIILACETIPNIMEIKVLTQLLNEYKYSGWITMPCCNEYQLNSKELVSDAIDIIFQYNINKYVIGIGFNCTNPKYIDALIKLTKSYKFKQNNMLLIVYPNSGEQWDGINKKWLPNTTMNDRQYAQCALGWYKLGANIIGGCCRTSPSTIHQIKTTVLNYINTHQTLKSKL